MRELSTIYLRDRSESDQTYATDHTLPETGMTGHTSGHSGYKKQKGLQFFNYKPLIYMVAMGRLELPTSAL